jgi:hypothetical protein
MGYCSAEQIACNLSLQVFQGHPSAELFGQQGGFGQLHAFGAFPQVPGKGLIQHDMPQEMLPLGPEGI